MTQQYHKLNIRHVGTLGSVVIKRKTNSTISGGVVLRWESGTDVSLRTMDTQITTTARATTRLVQ